jgi:hypothetical protein
MPDPASSSAGRALASEEGEAAVSEATTLEVLLIKLRRRG